MRVIDVRNVGEALPEALRQLALHGIREESRNGDVIRFPGPVSTVYREPAERVLFYPQRDANPFFHFFESLWMLAGRKDVEFPAKFVTRMRAFSDDGKTFHGAYGYRWRYHFDRDQMAEIARNLSANPSCRRQVLGFWDPRADLSGSGKDLPCNVAATFQVSEGKLSMVVFNRSNDLVWGAYGANAVHLSYLHEWVAATAGFKLGTYTQVSVNLHAYDNPQLGRIKELEDFATSPYRVTQSCPYRLGEVAPLPLGIKSLREGLRFLEDCYVFINSWGEYGPDQGWSSPYLDNVARPLAQAYDAYRAGDPGTAKAMANDCFARDWAKACIEWIERRQK